MGGCRIKVCGVTNVSDALMCVAEGVDAIGVNVIDRSARCVSLAQARQIADAVGDHALVVGVVADLDVAAMLTVRQGASFGCLQLHGDEPPSVLAPLLPHAYKALRIGDLAREREYGGDHILIDGPNPGSGHAFDWSLACELARRRKVTIAGGLLADNVAEAIRVACPYCVDVASGVEVAGDPRRKDAARVRAFVKAARGP